MAKKRNAMQTTSNPKGAGRKPSKRTLVLSDGTKVVADDNNKRYAGRKKVFNTKADPEATLPEPKDELSKHKYPPPKKDKIFRDKWGKFIDLVTQRDSFRIAHLDTLEILCDLYVELDALNAYIRTNGMTYEIITITGRDRAAHLEVARRDKVRVQIQNYTKFLDLFPKKDKSAGGDSDGEDDNWS